MWRNFFLFSWNLGKLASFALTQIFIRPFISDTGALARVQPVMWGCDDCASRSKNDIREGKPCHPDVSVVFVAGQWKRMW
jgi:hypothetical protein